MSKVREIMNRPITWGDSAKASIVALGISAAIVFAAQYHPIEFIRLFIAKLRNKDSKEA